MDSLHYSMLIQWSDEDQEYIVTAPELPGCRTHGNTYEGAAIQGEEAIQSWIMDAIADNEPIPPPKLFKSTASLLQADASQVLQKAFILAGDDEDDAKPYQEKAVRDLLRRLDGDLNHE